MSLSDLWSTEPPPCCAGTPLPGAWEALTELQVLLGVTAGKGARPRHGSGRACPKKLPGFPAKVSPTQAQPLLPGIRGHNRPGAPQECLTSKVLSTCWQTPIRSFSPFRNGSTAGRAPLGKDGKRWIRDTGGGLPRAVLTSPGVCPLPSPTARAAPSQPRCLEAGLLEQNSGSSL